MSNFIWALGASVLVSLGSLVGIFSLLVKEERLHKILFLLIGFAAGGLIGGAFLHLLPEALERSNSIHIFLFTIIGFIFFFILEKYFYWRHCHNGVCDIHAFSYLNLIGDTIHNFSDGLIMGTSFTVSIHFGALTTLIIIFHEIPQEIGDFGVLVYGGLNRFRALYYNFLSALACVIGTITGYGLSEDLERFTLFLLPFIAGGFIYIAACDLVPELHKEPSLKRATLSMLAFLSGISFILLARLAFRH